MRTIKFRAISECRGEHWVYGDLRHYNRNPHTEKWTIHDPATGIETDIDPNTVGQFTGLHDKNGTEIYEGDICKHIRGKVRSIDGRWIENVAFLEVKYKQGEFSIANYSLCMENFEVIGNVHDNPELLEGGAQ